MELMDFMHMESFVVLGSTANKEKTAYEIKNVLKEHNKKVYCIREEYNSIDQIEDDIDVLDICMNPKFTLEYLNFTKKIKGAIIQPGAESDEVEKKLNELGIPFIHGCVLIGCKRLDHGE